ncbi:tubulin-tyrosine ligase family-domain-containing protein [Syncephalastrum racemosum]|uniref:Tubulin-tyrosine ligase family-domain-containing protein n=1 Tax=Syncephalastrum racemosum TaxID=13706 RepID=A0A1X2HJU7_SYNRA|nr:tubulin-tyrosine ligase family-domain-containing protein [Syncephalastrum racemosum]
MSAFEAFITVHQYQLAAIPEDLWLPLFQKLGEDYLDAGTAVELHYGDPLDGYSLHVKGDSSLKKHGDIFLIDHAWTTKPEDAKKELLEAPGLLERLENLMDIEKPDLEESEDEDEDHEVDDEAIRLVSEQAHVSHAQAKEALAAEKYEVVNAIMRLTMDEDFKKETERLQEQVMGQLIASGKAQEKEDKVAKEKEERRKKREADWMAARVHQVTEAMWGYLQTYSFSVLQQNGQPATQTAWYINDEVGSALAHSSDPNMVCLPFIFSRGASGMMPYSVMFPIKDIAPGEILTIDMVPKKIERAADKAAYLLAFEHRLVAPLSDEEKKAIVDSFKQYQATLNQRTLPEPSAPPKPEAFREDGKAAADAVRVYTTTEFVKRFLTLPKVKFVDAKENANIIWSSQDVMDWDKLTGEQTINQLRYEECMTYKQRLAQLIQESYGAPSWLPTTYDITCQLGEFVGDYLETEEDESKEHNLWIAKPWNFARGLEISVSGSLPYLIRQHDAPTPKIVQRYLTQPCLYNQKKFDLRYIVLVRRTKPELVACVYNMFWIRLANKKFNLEDLDDYERQFTVMNYSNYQMTQLDYKSFIHNMEKQHSIQWDGVQKDINRAMKDVLTAAATQPEPLGLVPKEEPSYDAFSIYGFDVMLTHDYKPVILEVNFSPDCTRACEYDPNFVNNIFSVVDSRFDNVEKGLEAFTVL